MRIWIYLVEMLFGGGLLVRLLDAAGDELGIFPLEDVARLQPPLPPTWLDPTRPWAAPVTALQAALHAANLAGLEALIELEVGPEVTAIEIGLRDPVDWHWPLWGILAVEVISQAERLRAEVDEQRRRDTLSQVLGALGRDENDRALLRPNQQYTLHVAYEVALAARTNRDRSRRCLTTTKSPSSSPAKTNPSPSRRRARAADQARPVGHDHRSGPG